MLLNIFILCLGVFFTLLLTWSFRNLPGDGWQIVAGIPIKKMDSGEWKGVTLTFYGLFISLSVTISALLFFVMMGSLGVGSLATSIFSSVIILSCLTFSRIMARVIEKKHNTLTIGGASFAAIILIPVFVVLINFLFYRSEIDFSFPAIPTLAALSISYSFGEGIGRLACISFGCCYGPKLARCNPFVQKMFARYHFSFSEETRKISYASSLGPAPVLPIQAVTSTLYILSGLVALYMWFSNLQYLALLLSIWVTQGWRFLSEFLRADFRGESKISAYQLMSLVAIAYIMVIVRIIPSESVVIVDLAGGIKSCLDPLVIFLVQFLSIAVFLFTGVSSVIGSRMTFFIYRERV